jgi:hypothetical protein
MTNTNIEDMSAEQIIKESVNFEVTQDSTQQALTDILAYMRNTRPFKSSGGALFINAHEIPFSELSRKAGAFNG